MAGPRTVGVEEELLLVDPATGQALAVAQAALRRASADQVTDEQGSGEQAGAEQGAGPGPGGTLEAELYQQQVETDTPPQTDLAELETHLRRWRQRADEAAVSAGSRVAALGTSPLPVRPLVTETERYQRMADEFGLTVEEQLACGFHVHVSIDSRAEGVAVLDRIRDWLPVLTALSANSPFWQGRDTGFASFRTQVWGRWPSAGPIDVMGDVPAYDALLAQLLGSGVPLDHGMLYFDVRLSERYPTVEVRAADVCLEVADAVLVAALARAMVDTAAREWRAGVPPIGSRTALLRMAMWRASRSGVAGQLLDPRSGRPAPAADVVAAAFDHVEGALTRNGDTARVTARVEHVLAHGSGAQRQREAYERTGDLAAVVAEARALT